MAGWGKRLCAAAVALCSVAASAAVVAPGSTKWARGQAAVVSGVGVDGSDAILHLEQHADSAGSPSMFLVKTDPNGAQTLWSTNLADVYDCYVSSMLAVTPMGNSLVDVGCKVAGAGISQGTLSKVGPDGAVAWQVQTRFDQAIATDSAGSAVLVSGGSKYDSGTSALTKYDYNGTLVFDQVFSDPSHPGSWSSNLLTTSRPMHRTTSSWSARSMARSTSKAS